MTKTLEQLAEELDTKIPRDVISKRDAGNGRKLDYLEAWYVIDRMNKIFGHVGWDRETIELKQLPGERPAYMAKVRVTVRYHRAEDKYENECRKEGHGFGNAKGSSQDHELAIKEAESDAFKRAAMQFGLSMGLALYDKSQEFVEDAQPIKTSIPDHKSMQPKINIPPSDGVTVVVRSEKPAKEVKAQISSQQPTKEKVIKDTIKEKFRALHALGKIDKEKFIDKFLKPYNVDMVDKLSDVNADSCLQILKKEYAELN